MALTNYVVQSVVFRWLFYGYGLGLFGKVGVATALTIGTSVYVAQIVFSAHWLLRYRFGRNACGAARSKGRGSP